MMFRLMMISSMYPEYIRNFRRKIPDADTMSFDAYSKLLLSDSTEFLASYYRAFLNAGVDVFPVVANDDFLQKKWSGSKISGGSKEILLSQIANFQPDVLWIEDLRFLDFVCLKNLKRKNRSIKLLVAYHCAPVQSLVLEKLKLFDLIITCTPGLQDQLESEGINAHLVYHGFDKEYLSGIMIDKPIFLNDIIFTGSLFNGKGYHNERIELIEYILNSGIDISLYLNLESPAKIFARRMLYMVNQTFRQFGNNHPERFMQLLEYGSTPVKYYSPEILKRRNSPIFGKEMYRLLKNSKIVLNNHGEVAGSYAGNMRLFEATGVGTCLLTDNKSNMKELFEPGKEVIVYESPADCVEKINWLLSNEQDRSKIAESGQIKTLNAHTVADRVQKIIKIIQSELNKFN